MAARSGANNEKRGKRRQQRAQYKKEAKYKKQLVGVKVKVRSTEQKREVASK